MEIVRIEPIADGRIFTGQEAKRLGLVDRLGNFQDAVQWAGELGGIEGEVDTVYPEKARSTLLQYLMESALQLLTRHTLQTPLKPQARMDF